MWRGAAPRWRSFGFALLFVIAVVPGAFSQSVRTPWEESVMAVLAVDPGAGKFLKRATAFHVGDGVFYTNAHVVRGALPANFSELYLADTTATRTRDTWMGPIHVSCVHARWTGAGDGEHAFPYDVARFEVPRGSHLPPALTVSKHMPELGMHVTAIGFAAASHGWPPKLYTARGRVSDIDYGAQTFMIEVESGFALEGSSGSPVLTDEHEVIGILYARQGLRNRSAADRVAAVTTQAMQSACR